MEEAAQLANNPLLSFKAPKLQHIFRNKLIAG